MKARTILLNITILFSLLSAACGTGAASTPDAMMAHATDTPDTMMANSTETPETMMTGATETPEAMMPQDTAAPGASGGSMVMADWLGTALADARTGKGFKISDFSGKVVLVETMAVWCTNCHAQQQQIEGLQGLLDGNPDLVSVSLDIDPNETPDILMKYVAANSSFNWRYAIAPANLTREIGQTYGDQFLNPTSTPILIIDRHGIAHPLPFGIKNAADLMKTIQPYLDDHM
jgi:cytochrome oxidase Cu insertion factor (SCO1/SenC/PrrC family)